MINKLPESAAYSSKESISSIELACFPKIIISSSDPTLVGKVDPSISDKQKFPVLMVTINSPVFDKIKNITPKSLFVNLVVRVVQVECEAEVGCSSKIAEFLVADDSGSIMLRLRDDQLLLAAPGSSLILRNARVAIYSGRLRLEVDKWGSMEATLVGPVFVDSAVNLSDVKYDLAS